ncbi:hypothetical protein PSHT_09687 [Puccinia striiformis]|uniref:Uncharacterized protein n=1 Tax=Puccinia striiformis TaxID=27350 RepID=A0A2S4VEX2_9BASI|nr:hypothetical protein PSHT_09687 [Puccinia striiformis]
MPSHATPITSSKPTICNSNKEPYVKSSLGMFLQTRASVVYGALLTFVMGSLAISPRARLARRMEPAVFGGERELASAKGSEIFTRSNLEYMYAYPEESGLTLMEFHKRAGREMGVDPGDMDRFVNSFLRTYLQEHDKFQLQRLYVDHSEWLETIDINQERRDKALAALSMRIKRTPEESLHDYYVGKMDSKILTLDEDKDFVTWKLAQEWRSQYKDTPKLKIQPLLNSYMKWAEKDSKLKGNFYVLEYNKELGKESKTIIKLVEGLKRSSWHWKIILRRMKRSVKKFINMVLRRTEEKA